MATEQHLRQQLAAAYRLAALFGWEDTLYTHFSVRLPGDGEPRFLINPFGMMFDEVTASNLIVVDMQGKVVDVVQTGYMLGDKVLRFAKVVVGE